MGPIQGQVNSLIHQTSYLTGNRKIVEGIEKQTEEAENQTVAAQEAAAAAKKQATERDKSATAVDILNTYRENTEVDALSKAGQDAYEAEVGKVLDTAWNRGIEVDDLMKAGLHDQIMRTLRARGYDSQRAQMANTIAADQTIAKKQQKDALKKHLETIRTRIKGGKK